MRNIHTIISLNTLEEEYWQMKGGNINRQLCETGRTHRSALLMTWFNTRNYGTLLQAYATKEIFRDRYGIDTYFALYYPKGKRDFKSVLCKLFTMKSWKRQMKIRYDRFQEKRHGLDQIKREKLRWIKEFTALYPMANGGEEIRTKDDFKRLGTEFDLFISGSDQIWNPQSVNEHFLLNFVPENKVCISFASSLSTDFIPEKKAEVYRKHLAKYKSITIREPECAKQLSEIAGKEVNVILDPTVLFGVSKWKELSAPPQIKGRKLYINLFFGKITHAAYQCITNRRDPKDGSVLFPTYVRWLYKGG